MYLHLSEMTNVNFLSNKAGIVEQQIYECLINANIPENED